jgi:hypothetical protein
VSDKQRLALKLGQLLPPLPADALPLLIGNLNHVVRAAIAALMAIPILHQRQGAERAFFHECLDVTFKGELS